MKKTQLSLPTISYDCKRTTAEMITTWFPIIQL